MDQTANTPGTAWTPRKVALATLTVLGVVCVFYLLFTFRLVFFSLFVAIVLSTAIDPLMSRLSRWGMPRALSIILISLVALLILVLLVITVVPLISEQWATITGLITKSYTGLHQTMLDSPSILLQRIARQMPSFVPFTPTSLPSAPPQPTPPAAGPKSAEVAAQALALGGLVIHDLILGISVLLLTGLWIIEGDIATRVMIMVLPQPRREPVRVFLSDMEDKVGAYTRGLALLTFIVGALAALAYAVIGLPNVLLLGVIAGLMEIVPLIGPLLGAIPAVLVAASVAPDKLIWVISAYVLIQALESHLIVPRVMDRTVGVNPVASLLAFIAFGSIFGFLGALLAVPLAAVIQLVLNRLVFKTNSFDQLPLTGRSTISSLRYEAQNLALDVRKQVRDKGTEVTSREDRIEDAMEAVVQDLDSILAQIEITESAPNQPNGGQAA